MIKSCSAFGPNFNVILLVNSLEIGFSIYHDSCLTSLFTMLSPVFLPFSVASSVIENGSSGLPNFSLIYFLLYWKEFESIESSTICSQLVRFPTFKVDPKSLPGKKLL